MACRTIRVAVWRVLTAGARTRWLLISDSWLRRQSKFGRGGRVVDMREVFREWYSPSPAEYETLWAEGGMVFDAGALLSLYRSRNTFATRYLDLLDALSERLWLPYQAGHEFHQNRLGEIKKQRSTYDQIRNDIDTFQTRLRQSVARHSVLGSADFLEESARKATELKALLSELEASHGWPPDESPSGDDGILARLDSLFQNRVGEQLVLDEARRADAEVRMQAKTPPGYKDYQEVSNPIPGDLVIWWELLQEANAGNRFASGVIFVTDDGKEDWWWIDDGRRIGPRVELVREARAAGIPSFWMQTPEAFLRSGARHFGWELEELEAGLEDTQAATEVSAPEA